jgi:uncharacterized protein YjbJ (UPF0337 family)
VEWRREMNAQEAQIQGHIKEIAGIMADDKELEKQGKSERRSAEVQGKVDQAKDAVHDAVDKAQDKVDEVMDKAKDALKS